MSQFTPRSSQSFVARIGLASFAMLAIGAALVGCGKAPAATAQPTTKGAIQGQTLGGKAPSAQVNLTIVAQKPGGSIQGPAFMPSTSISLPAHSVVTITIVNADAGDTALPSSSPFAQVSGVVGGQAYVDGVAYSSLAPDKVAHTFTIPGLGVNVPIPGDAPAGQNGITVTFSFKTGNAGTFMWQCMDPCGADPNGWGGPMASMGYMMGTAHVIG